MRQKSGWMDDVFRIRIPGGSQVSVKVIRTNAFYVILEDTQGSTGRIKSLTSEKREDREV